MRRRRHAEAMLSRSSAMRVASSAGKNDSIASSDSVTSSGVPKTVIVLISDSVASPTRSLQQVRDRGALVVDRAASA